MEICAEDLTVGRSQAADDDDDDHDDHDDSDKINDVEGVDPERLKAFNVSRKRAVQSHSKPRGFYFRCMFYVWFSLIPYTSFKELIWQADLFFTLRLDVCTSLCG